MSEPVKVALADSFLESFAKLPSQAQRHVTDFMVKFRSNPLSPAIHYEKIASKLDKNVWSVRIDDTYRGIVLRQDKSGIYLLIWVAHHDEAYIWASRKRCQVNPFTGAIQVYTVEEVPETVTVQGLFQHVSDNDLLKLGVPQDQLPLIRSFTVKEDLSKHQMNMSADVYEGLSWLAEEIPLEEVLDLLHAEKAAKAPKDLRSPLDTSANQRFFRVVEGEDELKAMLDWPLEKWRVFLHPTQREIVEKNYSGSARVMGGAGTGKTVVAMHRAKRLAGNLTGRDKLLFTTFTANLADDIRDNLKKICSREELRQIEVINLDAWVANYMRNAGYESQVQYDERMLQKEWESAIEGSQSDMLGYPVRFYQEEWERVVIPQHALTLIKYMRSSRHGRGVPLDGKKRRLVWKVFESYQQSMRAKGWRDVQWAMDECRALLEKSGRMLYPHIIVDEGQDFGPVAMKLIRCLAGTEHANDIFIVGDSHQRIYRNKTVLKQCGIKIQGRSSLLHINYRTTEETRSYAFAVLNGISFDDMDGEMLTKDECQSLTHGEKPVVKTFTNANQEIDYIETQIKELENQNVSLQNICITARTHGLLDNYIQELTARGFRCYELKKGKLDDRQQPGIRFAAMHRVKGLEFRYVFVVGVNQNIVPLRQAVDVDEPVAKREAMTAERCLFYVALTRAREGAYITSYGRKSPFL